MRKLYIEKQLSVVETAKLTGWPCSTIKNAIQKYSLSRDRKPKHERFGWKKVSGQLIEHKGEQKIIYLILELREQGLSCPKIAIELNNKNYSTKHKKSWTKSTVQEVIKKNL